MDHALTDRRYILGMMADLQSLCVNLGAKTLVNVRLAGGRCGSIVPVVVKEGVLHWHMAWSGLQES